MGMEIDEPSHNGCLENSMIDWLHFDVGMLYFWFRTFSSKTIVLIRHKVVP
jgi:hypothetical protein